MKSINEQISQSQIQRLINKESKIIIILFDSVYDLTKFAQHHPGGKQILLEYNGKNATQFFVQVGHLKGANLISTLSKFRIGKFHKLKAKL